MQAKNSRTLTTPRIVNHPVDQETSASARPTLPKIARSETGTIQTKCLLLKKKPFSNSLTRMTSDKSSSRPVASPKVTAASNEESGSSRGPRARSGAALLPILGSEAPSWWLLLSVAAIFRTPHRHQRARSPVVSRISQT